MNKTRKISIKRILLVFILIGSLLGVQAMEALATSTDDPVQLVEVSTYDELVVAIDAAQDGDVIGLTATIETTTGFSLGSPDKHVTIKRMDAYAFFQLSGGIDDQVQIQNITFDGNNLEAGHNFLIIGCNSSFEGCTFINSISQGSGGVMYITGNTEFKDCIFDNNRATNGGHIAVSNSATVTMLNSTLKNGQAANQGGAIHTQTQLVNLYLTDSVVSENHSEAFGGGIVSTGFIKLERSKIFSNIAVNGGADIVSFGTMEMVEELENLQALYGEKYIINGWVSDYEDPDVESGASYLKLDYEVIPEPDPEPTEVILAESSLGVADDSKITGLGSGKYYKVTTGEAVSYSKADGTLTLEESEAAQLIGTEIIGLTNGITYKVEEYVPSEPEPTPDSTPGEGGSTKPDPTPQPTPTPDTDKNDEATTPPSNSTSTINNDNSSVRHDNSETKNDYSDSNNTSTVNNYYTTDSSTHTSKTEASQPTPEPVVTVINPSSTSESSTAAPVTSEPVTNDEKDSEAASDFKNIRIEANGADCVFEINEDGYNISINANGNNQDSAPGSTSSLNWYEIVKICLLAAIVVTLLWKPRKAEKSDLI